MYVKKTNYVIFKPRQRIAIDDFNISFGIELLKQTNATKFLGVYLDEHLTWKHHTLSFFIKANRKIASRFYLSSRTKLALHYPLIYPYMHPHCNSTWSSTYVSNINRLFYLPKGAVQAITNSDYQAHSDPLFAKLGIMDIFQKFISNFKVHVVCNYYYNQLERVSIECRKTKTKVITLDNQKKLDVITRSRHKAPGKCARVSHDWFWFRI